MKTGDVCARIGDRARARAAWAKAFELFRADPPSANDPRGDAVLRKVQRLQ